MTQINITYEDLIDLYPTKTDLLIYCRNNNITNYSGKNKKELIDYIINYKKLTDTKCTSTDNIELVKNITPINKIENEILSRLSEEQYKAYKYITNSIINKLTRVIGLCGGAGTGKTETLVYILKTLLLKNISYIITATTCSACRTIEKKLTEKGLLEIKSFTYKTKEYVATKLNEINNKIKKLIKIIDDIENEKQIYTFLKTNIYETVYNNIKIFKNTFLICQDIIMYNNTVNSNDNILKKYKIETENNKIYTENGIIINEKIQNEINNKALNEKNEFNIKTISDIINHIKLCLKNNKIDNKLNNEYPMVYNSLISEMFNIIYDENQTKTIYSILKFELTENNNKEDFECEHIDIIKNNNNYIFKPKYTKLQLEKVNDGKYNETMYFNNIYPDLKDNILFIDEASMLTSKIYYYLLYLSNILNITIIFIGDNSQLSAIEKDNDIDTDIFDNIPVNNLIILNKIERSNYDDIRYVNKIFRDFTYSSDIYNSEKDLNILLKKIYNGNYQHVKIYDSNTLLHNLKNIYNYNVKTLCRTNKEVNNTNIKQREILLGLKKEQYCENEFILCNKYNSFYHIDIEYIKDIEQKINYYKDNVIDLTCMFNYIFDKLNKNDIRHCQTGDKIMILKKYNSLWLINNNNKIYIDSLLCTDGYEYFMFFSCFENEYIENLINDKITELENMKKNTIYINKCNENCKIDIKCEHMTCKGDDWCTSKHIRKTEKKDTNIKTDTRKYFIIHCNKCKCKSYCSKCKTCNEKCEFCCKKHIVKYYKLKSELIKNLKDIFTKQICTNYISYNEEYKSNMYKLSYDYSCTVHKSQGLTLDSVIIDYNNLHGMLYWLINKNKEKKIEYYKEHFKYLYVCISRAQNNIYFIIDNKILNNL